MKRAIVAAVLVLMMAAPASAQTEIGTAEQIGRWRAEECRYRSLYGSPQEFSYEEMVLTARCAVDHFPVPGGFAMLNSVVACESGWGPDAVSPTGSYRGLMQLGYSEFHSNVGPMRWPVKREWTNPRSNLLAGVRLAHRVGWGPWTCA